jgi:hypothetical protein
MSFPASIDRRTLAAVGSSGLKRKGRRHLRKLRARSGHFHSRGGVIESRHPVSNARMFILDGGRDAPLSPKGMNIFYGVLFAVILVGMAALVWTQVS